MVREFGVTRHAVLFNTVATDHVSSRFLLHYAFPQLFSYFRERPRASYRNASFDRGSHGRFPSNSSTESFPGMTVMGAPSLLSLLLAFLSLLPLQSLSSPHSRSACPLSNFIHLFPHPYFMRACRRINCGGRHYSGTSLLIPDVVPSLSEIFRHQTPADAHSPFFLSFIF